MRIPRIPRSLKIPAFTMLLAFTPFLRSCGDVSYGLPFVSIEAGSPYAFESARPLLMLINIAIAAACIFCIRYFLRNKKDILKGGTQGVLMYQIVTWIAYLVIYPVSSNIKFVEYIAGIFLYFLYPFYAFAYDIHLMIPAVIEKSRFFGDADDIPLRLMYIAMMGIWFILGYIRIKISGKRK